MKARIAKGIRAITVPPVLVSAALVLLYGTYGSDFASVPMLVCAIFFLGLMPLLAYPLAALWQRRSGNETVGASLRDKQRRLAFMLNLAGYGMGAIVGWLFHCTAMMAGVLSGYLIGAVLLTIFNKGFHIKASGHACSGVMAYLLLGYWLGLKAFLVCIPLYICEFWASIFLKRHTSKEFLWGTGIAVLSFFTQWMLYLL